MTSLRSSSACLASSLLSGTVGDEGERFFAHRWTASELDRRLTDAASRRRLIEAHVRAADYWDWRVSVWPQSRAADVHDLLEARHHLLAADDVERAGEMTESACATLHDLGSWDEEAALIHDTLARLPPTSERRAPGASSSGSSRRTAATTPKPSGNISNPSRSRSASEAKLAWPPATTNSECSRRRTATTPVPSSATNKHSRSTSASKTKPAWPAATASSGSSPRPAATTPKPSSASSNPSRSTIDLETRPAWRRPTTTSGELRRAAATTPKPTSATSKSLQINERLGNQAGMASGYQPARDPRASPRRLRRSRAALPAIPADQRAPRKPSRHGRQLPPTRDARARPRRLRRSRAALPAIPPDQ